MENVGFEQSQFRRDGTKVIKMKAGTAFLLSGMTKIIVIENASTLLLLAGKFLHTSVVASFFLALIFSFLRIVSVISILRSVKKTMTQWQGCHADKPDKV